MDDRKLCIKCKSLMVIFKDGTYKDICIKCGQNQNQPIKLDEDTSREPSKILKFVIILSFICLNIVLISVGVLVYGFPSGGDTFLTPTVILIGFDIIFVVFMVYFYED